MSANPSVRTCVPAMDGPSLCRMTVAKTDRGGFFAIRCRRLHEPAVDGEGSIVMMSRVAGWALATR